MVFAVANQEMAFFGPLDGGAMRRLNYEVRFRHAEVTRQPCSGTGGTWFGVADNTDLENSTLPYPLQEPPALPVVTEVVLTEVEGIRGRFYSVQACNKGYIRLFLSSTKVRDKQEKMLNEILLTTTICIAIVGDMALFYGELELLQHNH